MNISRAGGETNDTGRIEIVYNTGEECGGLEDSGSDFDTIR
jgi:hypothetical protein